MTTAIAPTTETPRPPVFIPQIHVPPLPAVSAPPVASPQAVDLRPSIELIYEPGGPGLGELVAVILPRQVSQQQLLIAEALIRAHFRLRIDLSIVWDQWRVYASPLWHPTAEASVPAKPTGPKLFFA